MFGTSQRYPTSIWTGGGGAILDFEWGSTFVRRRLGSETVLAHAILDYDSTQGKCLPDNACHGICLRLCTFCTYPYVRLECSTFPQTPSAHLQAIHIFHHHPSLAAVASRHIIFKEPISIASVQFLKFQQLIRTVRSRHRPRAAQ